MSSDYQWLYVGAPDSDTVLTYRWQNVTSVTDTVVIPNANVATFTLSNISTSFSELLLVSNSSVDFVPYRDYTISGSDITFTSNAQPDTYVFRLNSGFRNAPGGIFTGNSNTDFGRSVSCTPDGRQVVIGAPLETVSGESNAGSITVYDRSIEKYIAIADQTLFGGYRPLATSDKVYVNGTLQVLESTTL